MLTLNDEPRLGCSSDGTRPFSKILTLSEETKLVRLDQTRFKVTYPIKKSPQDTKKAEKTTTIKCFDAGQCDEWIAALTLVLTIVKEQPGSQEAFRRSMPTTTGPQPESLLLSKSTSMNDSGKKGKN